MILPDWYTRSLFAACSLDHFHHFRVVKYGTLIIVMLEEASIFEEVHALNGFDIARWQENPALIATFLRKLSGKGIEKILSMPIFCVDAYI